MRDTVQTICVNPCNLWLTYSYRPYTLPLILRHLEEAYRLTHHCLGIVREEDGTLDLFSLLGTFTTPIPSTDYEKLVFTVQANAQGPRTEAVDHILDYGPEPPDLYPTILHIELRYDGVEGILFDRLWLVINSRATKTKHDAWHSINIADLDWTILLPYPFIMIGVSGGTPSHPDPQNPRRWNAPDTLSTYLHHDAAFGMLSFAVEDYRHQATYDEKGVFISEGVRAGRPHRYDYAQHPSLHQTEDIDPFIRAAQLDGNPCLFTGTGVTTDFERPMVHEGAYLKQYLACRPPMASTEWKLDTILFQTPHMDSPKVVEDYQHLGAFTGQGATFMVTTKPFFHIPDGFLSWGGIAPASTAAKPHVTFTAPNTGMEAVTVTANGSTLTANVAVRNQPTGMGQQAFTRLHAIPSAILYSHNILARPMTDSEAWVWANATYPGQLQVNTINDAARHAYWTCLMTRFVGENYARGLGMAHEVSATPAPGRENETVMDLHNNEMGIQIANHAHAPNLPNGNPDFTCCRNAIQNAISNGMLWHMDYPANTGGRGLLQPTNK